MKFYYLKKKDSDEFTGSVELPIAVSKNLKQLLCVMNKCNSISDSETTYKVEELNIKALSDHNSNIVTFLIEDVTDFDWVHREIKLINLESNIDNKDSLKEFYIKKSRRDGNDYLYYFKNKEIKNSLTKKEIDFILETVNL